MKAVIFDFNGTMVFDDKFHEKAWRTFFSETLGREITDREFADNAHGKTTEDILAYFLGRKIDKSEIDTLEEEKESIYRRLCLESKDYTLVKGLEDFLCCLSANNIPFTIATSSALPNLKFFFSYFGLDRWFDIEKVAYNDGTINGKPAPDIYLKAAEKLGVDIQDCTVFEDAKSGIESAFSAKAGTIICVGDKVSEETLCKNGVSKVISDYTDIII